MRLSASLTYSAADIPIKLYYWSLSSETLLDDDYELACFDVTFFFLFELCLSTSSWSSSSTTAYAYVYCYYSSYYNFYCYFFTFLFGFSCSSSCSFGSPWSLSNDRLPSTESNLDLLFLPTLWELPLFLEDWPASMFYANGCSFDAPCICGNWLSSSSSNSMVLL